ncbi:radical SAM family heme chaperone HemW [Thiopseudomonas acetoxidans]|uniref:Heme chaperone HemW n=1 Tax=Thiopseudomonas acetoxidans TaxID=3041622 RepID=A0ABT7SKK5_9GAMM|nr:radical SAM family heme chaperone HemW [Thiopseudomonas sp. CY1220]MDM7856720.1 radical SAM family heme chaperone HemW [Thiopseudomonas sp. CY1220]
MSQLISTDSTRLPFADLPPLSLYVHIPWCVRKCPYCDFNSHTTPTRLPENAYVDSLLSDLQLELEHIVVRPLSSIFIGGGTPSLFSATAFARLLAGIQDVLPWQDAIEITLEANPGTFEQAKFAAYRQLGINRLSIGVQSFNDQHLTQLGRLHNANEAQQAVAIAQRAGFTNINLDLMHGLPGQDLTQALADLTCAIELQPNHISWYQLTIEPNTVFWNQPPVLPEDDSLWDIQQAGQALLAEQGFIQYEVSAYAKPNKQAQHNLNYWQFGDYIGIGAGAHGKISSLDGRILRYWKTRQPNDYLNNQRRAGEQLLNNSELPFEFLMNALRLSQGVPSQLFTQRTGLPLNLLLESWEQAQSKGLMLSNPRRLAATEQGALFLNDLLQIFLTSSN